MSSLEQFFFGSMNALSVKWPLGKKIKTFNAVYCISWLFFGSFFLVKLFFRFCFYRLFFSHQPSMLSLRCIIIDAKLLFTFVYQFVFSHYLSIYLTPVDPSWPQEDLGGGGGGGRRSGLGIRHPLSTQWVPLKRFSSPFFFKTDHDPDHDC